MKIISSLFIVMATLLACEKEIYPTLQEAQPVLVVDAWINSKNEKQVITLSYTQPYLDSSAPAPFSGAQVTVTDLNNGTVYPFVENPDSAGVYQWMPNPFALGQVGHNFQLTVLANGETFLASSYMGRVPAVDSITFRKSDRRSSNKKSEQYIGEFWATDPKGIGDAYWIRATVNDTLLTLPSEIDVAYDAGLSAGGDADGVTFFPAIRRGITPDRSSSNSDRSPLIPGDSVYVEIYSVSLAAYDHLGQVKTQTNRPSGFGQLFTTPLANVSTNIKNVVSSGSSVVGFFNVSAVTGKGQRFRKVS